MPELLFSESAAYLPDARVAVIMAGAGPAGKVRKSVGTPAVPNSEPVKFEYLGGNNIAFWGENNLFPQEIIALAEQNTELPALLDWKARAAQGKEVLPYTRFWDEASNDWKEKPILDPDIWDFFQRETTKRYFREAYTDFYWFWNVFPDLIKNEEGDQIAYIGTHDASWCRWYRMNDNGVVDKAIINSYWEGGLTIQTKYTMDMPVVDPYRWDLVDAVKAQTELKRFIFPTSYPSPGKAYYQLAPWDGIRSSGWLELMAKIPRFKDSVMKNQMSIKYLIKIPSNYWPAAYPLWETYTPEQKAAKKKEKLQEINKSLTDVENAGKTILNEYGFDNEGKPLPGWEITEIGDKLKDGAYIEDSQEGSAHLLRALSLDGTLVGTGPGRDLNAGGGSDKLIAYNMYVALLDPHRYIINSPVYFAARYNGWLERYPFFFIKTIEAAPQALDTSKKVSYQTQEQWPKPASSPAQQN